MQNRIKKTVIFTSYHCNNNCLFCIDSEKRNINPVSTNDIKNEILRAKKRGSTYLEFIGGEFTIRSDVFDLIAYAKQLGFENIVMATNGRILSYKNFAKRLKDAGMTDIVFSIHGHNTKIHDQLTNSPGSFKQLCDGLKNVKNLKTIRIGSNTTIVKQNYKKLPEIGKFLIKEGIKNAEFIFVDSTQGGAKVDFFKLVPKISEAAPYIHKCLDLGLRFHHWHIRYVPLCYFEKYLNRISEIDEIKHFKSEHIAPDFTNFEVEKSRAEVGRIKPHKCKKCKHFGLCEGIWKEYVKNYGDKELKPII